MSTQSVKELTATDIMSPDVVCLNEDLDMHECERILIDREISGAPVVDAHGRLRGVLSKTDLIAYHYSEQGEGTTPSPLYRIGGNRGGRIVEFDAPSARDVMTPVPCVATEGATLDELAALMSRKHVHRVVICRDRRVVGIVTTMDIMHAIASDVGEDWDPDGFPG
ncbi:MAG: CBS domain-containing protein [Acidobacteriota bacterium]